MNGPGATPGFHQGAEINHANAYVAQQYFAARDYEVGLPASVTWDLAAQQVRFITLSANTTFVFPTNGRRGATYILVLKQDGTGSRTGSYSAQNAGLGAGTWKWSSGTTPTLTTTAGKIDVLTFLFDGTHMIGFSALNF